MPTLDLATVDHLLTTTRAVRRRLDFDRPVPRGVILECLRLAIQAPTGGNRQGWRWMVVTDAAKRARLGDLYREGAGGYFDTMDDPDLTTQQGRVQSSARYLAARLQDAPVHVIPCIVGREPGPAAYGSIYPAAWSFQLALRSRGLGTCLTTLHLPKAREVGDLLGMPDRVVQAGLLPVAYFTGEDFRPAERVPVEEVTYWDSWGASA